MVNKPTRACHFSNSPLRIKHGRKTGGTERNPLSAGFERNKSFLFMIIPYCYAVSLSGNRCAIYFEKPIGQRWVRGPKAISQRNVIKSCSNVIFPAQVSRQRRVFYVKWRWCQFERRASITRIPRRWNYVKFNAATQQNYTLIYVMGCFGSLSNVPNHHYPTLYEYLKAGNDTSNDADYSNSFLFDELILAFPFTLH